MRQTRLRRRIERNRRGLTTPAVAVALLVTLAGLALILDRMWLETAQLELTTAAETTALAAARQLASDDRLRANFDPQDWLTAAQDAAEQIARDNRVAGERPSFSLADSDLNFGSYAQSDQGIVLDPDDADPHTVRITLHRTRSRNNPVALFIGQLTAVPFGDVRRQADATINNHIEGVRPVTGATVPALPLAIWKNDPTGNRQDTWQVQIDQRRGQDRFGYDEESHKVVRTPDGIPEIIVRSVARGGKPELCNLQVLDMGTGFDDEKLSRQFRQGWSAENLAEFGGLFPAIADVTLTSSAELFNPERDALEELLGEPRICLLFSTTVPTNNKKLLQTTCVELVAVRVMAVWDQPEGYCMLVLQPTVMATRCAVVTSTIGQPATQPPNKYIYNLRLTN